MRRRAVSAVKRTNEEVGMLLDGKVAVVYGAGSIGGAVARAFGAEGARVFVGDRTAAKAEALTDEIEAAGGSARGLAMDEDSVRGGGGAVLFFGGSGDPVPGYSIGAFRSPCTRSRRCAASTRASSARPGCAS
jgi:threonine dehydrogenase-like Zn-dependent dehydrogenase